MYRDVQIGTSANQPERQESERGIGDAVRSSHGAASDRTDAKDREANGNDNQGVHVGGSLFQVPDIELLDFAAGDR
jgi:hypothetical protein